MEKGIKKWRTIIIDKLNTKESDPMFCYHNFSQAVKGEVPFKLFFYFMSFEKGDTFEFHPTLFANDFNVSTTGIKSALMAMECQGYFKMDENGIYHFYNYAIK